MDKKESNKKKQICTECKYSIDLRSKLENGLCVQCLAKRRGADFAPNMRKGGSEGMTFDR